MVPGNFHMVPRNFREIYFREFTEIFQEIPKCVARKKKSPIFTYRIYVI